MQLTGNSLRLTILNIIWVCSDEKNLKTPTLKIIKDENSIVAMGLQKSFKRFSKPVSNCRAHLKCFINHSYL